VSNLEVLFDSRFEIANLCLQTEKRGRGDSVSYLKDTFILKAIGREYIQRRNTVEHQSVFSHGDQHSVKCIRCDFVYRYNDSRWSGSSGEFASVISDIDFMDL